MGQEIDQTKFARSDYKEFHQRLKDETAILERWFADGRFENCDNLIGLELEAWLVDKNGRPVPDNQKFLAEAGNPLVVPELSRYNIELNTEPVPLGGRPFSELLAGLEETIHHCNGIAQAAGYHVGLFGIPPTLRNEDLSINMISAIKRYYALNEQIMLRRKGVPMTLDIRGEEHLHAEHKDVMFESATTSLQIHYQVDQKDAVRAYNASKAVSAFTVAAGSNSPFLFGKSLWAETRIPVFEQAVSLFDKDDSRNLKGQRVSFGIRYAHESLFECFEANIERYFILLPILFDEGADELKHLKLHNGTVWRWNRPLVGFGNENNHAKLRIEHRVIAAGPTLADSVANTAFYTGLVRGLIKRDVPIEQELDFATAKANFYEACRSGLDAEIEWPGVGRAGIDRLILDELLPLAHQGLKDAGVDAADAEKFLGIIEARVRTGRTGTFWLRETYKKTGDFTETTVRYLEQQLSGIPVHEWNI